MLRTIEAVIEADGRVRLLEPVSLTTAHRALVTVLEESAGNITALLREPLFPTGTTRRRVLPGDSGVRVIPFHAGCPVSSCGAWQAPSHQKIWTSWSG